MAIEIEKGIPIPEVGRRKKGERLYPFKHLEPGDSFAVEKNGHKSWGFIFQQIKIANKEMPERKFTSRRIDDNTTRVWRTE